MQNTNNPGSHSKQRNSTNAKGQTDPGGSQPRAQSRGGSRVGYATGGAGG